MIHIKIWKEQSKIIWAEGTIIDALLLKEKCLGVTGNHSVKKIVVFEWQVRVRQSWSLLDFYVENPYGSNIPNHSLSLCFGGIFEWSGCQNSLQRTFNARDGGNW